MSSSGSDAAALRDLVDRGWRCQTLRSSSARDISPNVVLLDVDVCSDGQLDSVRETAGDAFIGVPLLVRTSLKRSSVSRVIALNGRAAETTVSLRGVDDLVRDVVMIGERLGDAAGTASIIAGLSPYWDGRVVDIAMAALLMGRRRPSVASLAGAMQLARRTVEWRLREAKQPRARDLLATAMCLHAAWRLGVLQWPIKRAAMEGGFRSRIAFNNFVRRQTGVPPTALRQSASFDRLLGNAREAWCSTCPAPLRIS